MKEETPGCENNPLISVIVASYNHAEFLTQRMDTLINQSYHNIEIIVIDDCSTDNSVEILNRYSDNPRVNLVINKKNSGWVKVSNLGISMSSGDFIIFANCDDSSEPIQLEKLVKPLIDNSGTTMCFSKSTMVDKDNIILGDDFTGREPAFKKYCLQDTLIPAKLMTSFLMHSCVIPNLSGVLIRKKDFLDCGGLSTEYSVVSDWDLFFKLCQIGDTYYISEPLNHFRQHEETIRATTKDKKIYEEIFTLLYSQFSLWDFSFKEKIIFRGYIASIWVNYFLRSKKSALSNFGFHLKLSGKYNSMALGFFLYKLAAYPFNRIIKKTRDLINI